MTDENTMQHEESAASSSGAFEDIPQLSFEQAMQELETIVRRLESGEASLEESLNDYKRGTALKAHCQKTLNDARLSVEKIMQSDQGAVATEPLDT